MTIFYNLHGKILLDMAKSDQVSVPIYNINKFCDDNSVADFKIAALNETTCTASEFDKEHKHDFFEIVWVKSGRGVHKIDMQDHHYEGAALFIMAPGQIHTIDAYGNLDGYVIKFLPSLFKNENDFYDQVLDTCLFDTNTSCPIISITEEDNQELEDIFVKMAKEFNRPDVDSEQIFVAYLNILITHINRLKRTKKVDSIFINEPQYALFRTFKLALEKHYKEEHSVQAYADMLAITSRTLNSISKKYAERSVSDVIHDRLLLEAKRSLHHEYKNVKEICYDLGFEDPAYFTRFFKKHTGMSPMQYKERQLKAV